jgi:hypothetical protein
MENVIAGESRTLPKWKGLNSCSFVEVLVEGNQETPEKAYISS